MISAALAKIAFTEYRNLANGLSVNNTVIPEWDKLPDNIKSYWIGAMEAARDAMRDALALEAHEKQQIEHAIHYAKNYGAARVSGSNAFVLIAKLAAGYRFK